jgi:hypothetical protein
VKNAPPVMRNDEEAVKHPYLSSPPGSVRSRSTSVPLEIR